jgi:acetyltransferase-like isoleucine patch superfamily enzyme
VAELAEREGLRVARGDCRIGSSAVIVAGATVGDRAYSGDHALIRETAVLADEAMVGRGRIVTHSTLVGNRARLQADVIVWPWTVIEDDVSVGPRVTFIGDPTMGRRPLEVPVRGIRVCRGARVGTGSIVFPPVTIGVEAVVGAASLVRDDVASRTVVVGTPAAPLRAVHDASYSPPGTTAAEPRDRAASACSPVQGYAHRPRASGKRCLHS